MMQAKSRNKPSWMSISVKVSPIVLLALIVFLLAVIAQIEDTSGILYLVYIAVLIVLALLVVIASSQAEIDNHIRFTNEFREERINNLVALLDLAEHSVVIVSGKFFSEIYNDNRVINALSQLPERVRIKLFFTSEGVDDQATKFLNWANNRNVIPIRLQNKICHCAIIDELHIKIEDYSCNDDDDEKHVDYYLHDSERSQKAIAEITSEPTH